MDESDRADAEVERTLAEALRAKKPEGPSPTGFCFWCDEPVEDTRRWCSPGCRDAWQKLTNGKG
jgi:hypothetical protein